MLQKLNKRNQEGFTIIEVLIVLAIAGLILLIVFLAVPALQRNQRNTSRKNDASHISTAIANFVSDNNGTLPGAESGTLVGATFDTDCTNAISSDVATLSQYGANGGKLTSWCNATLYTTGNMPTGKIEAATGALTNVTSSTNQDGLIYDEGAQCSGTGGAPTISTTAGSDRQSALIYTVESGGATYNLDCLNVT